MYPSSLHFVSFTRSSRTLSSQSTGPLLPYILLICTCYLATTHRSVQLCTHTSKRCCGSRAVSVVVAQIRTASRFVSIWLYILYTHTLWVYFGSRCLAHVPNVLPSSLFLRDLLAHCSRICIIIHMRLCWLLQPSYHLKEWK